MTDNNNNNDIIFGNLARGYYQMSIIVKKITRLLRARNTPKTIFSVYRKNLTHAVLKSVIYRKALKKTQYNSRK